VQPLVYSTFRYYKYDASDIDAIDPEPVEMLGGGLQRMAGVVNEPAVQIVIEDFFPGSEYRWTTFLDQVDWVVDGSCEITVELPPDYDRRETVVVEAPGLYLLPRGTRVIWRPLGDRPFRHISFDFPNPGFTIPMAASVQAAEKGGT
jgi:hypothetical protein